MSDFFGSGPLVRGNRKSQIEYCDPVVYDQENPDLYVVLEQVDSAISRTVSTLVTTIRKIVHNPRLRLRIVSAFPFKGSAKGNNFSVSFRKSGVDLSKYIPPGSKVLAEGKLVAALTEGDHNVLSFQDFITNASHFYDPKTKSEIFPIVHHNLWNSNGWDYQFSRRQVEIAYNYTMRRVRDVKVGKHKVTDVYRFFQEHYNKPEVAIDTETDNLDPFHANVGCITVAFDEREGYYLPWEAVKNDLSAFSRFIRDKYQVYMNGQYDTKVLRSNGVDPDALHIDYDVWHGGHLLNEMRPNSLKAQAWIYTRHGGYDRPLEEYKKKYRKVGDNYTNIPESVLLPYAVMDAVVTYQIYRAQLKHLEWVDKTFPPEKDQKLYPFPLRHTLSDYLFSYVLPSVRAMNDIEWEGMYINIDALRDEEKQLSQELAEKERKVREVFNIPESVNIDSQAQLGNFIANITDHLGNPKYPLKVRSKDKSYFLLNESIVNDLVKQGYSEFSYIDDYRSTNTRLNTFIGREEDNSGFWQYLHYYPNGDVKVHSSMLMFLADTGRNRSKNPNLQNIPSKKNKQAAKRVRRIFCPPSKDYYIVEADGAGYQLRIGAALSNDPEMKRAFRDETIGGDLHSVTAQAIFMPDITIKEFLDRLVNGDKEVEDFRQEGKRINLSLEFGASGFRFAQELQNAWSYSEVQHFVDRYKLKDTVDRLYKRSRKNSTRNENEPITREFCNYWAVAIEFRKRFFEKYLKLGGWTDLFSKYPKYTGYMRSVHGAFRRIPQLLHMGDASEEVDDGGLIKHLSNTAINSPVQNFENVVMSGKVIVGLHKYFKENNMKSRVATMVHDSVVLYVHKDEVEQVISKAKEIFEEDVPENNGVPMVLEAAVADYWGKGEVWGEGTNY